MTLFHCYRRPALSAYQTAGLLTTVREKVSPAIHGIETEFCFNIAVAMILLSATEILCWALSLMRPKHSKSHHDHVGFYHYASDTIFCSTTFFSPPAISHLPSKATPSSMMSFGVLIVPWIFPGARMCTF